MPDSQTPPTPASLPPAEAQRQRVPRFAILAAAVVLILAALFVWRWKSAPRARATDPLAATPILALAVVQSGPLYYNAAARPWLLSKRPELIAEEDRAEGTERVRRFVQAVQDPKLFRQLDREDRFNTLLLMGDPSQYQPLLEHLLEAKDWTLFYVDHTSIIFRRGDSVPRWTEAQLATLRSKIATLPAGEQAIVLGLVSSKLVALREMTAAKRLIEEAKGVDSGVPEVWDASSRYHLARGEWPEAIADADAALAIDGDYATALGSKAQALYSSKRFLEAYHCSERLVAKLGDEPAILLYHAKVAHEARAYGEEIKALQKLIQMAEAGGRSASGYRIYLAQAHARDGSAAPALEEYGKVLADPEITQSQRKEVEAAVALVRSRAAPVK